MDESKRPVHRRRPAWRPLSRIGLPLRADRPGRVSRVRQPRDDSNGSGLPHHPVQIPWPQPLLKGSLLTREDSPEVHNSQLSRFKLLSVDDLSPTEEASNDSDKESIGEGATVIHEYGFDDSDKGEDCGDPFLEDGFGNLTHWRLSDLNKELAKHLEDKLNEPKTKEKKQSKIEKLKWHNDRMEQYMKSALKKYNNEENLDEDFCFEFVKCLKESLIVEGACKFYRHFNFAAVQSGTLICMFFAEVIPDGETCDVTCCKLLQNDDNGRCLGCRNQGHNDLRHPASSNVYAGGHEDCMFPFLIDSDSEDDSD